jgi:hypothetical protein
MLNNDDLLAGVAAGVVLPNPNKDGFGVACIPEFPDGVAPPNELAVELVGGC